jgi:DNA-binding MarR family transcriptional regulator
MKKPAKKPATTETLEEMIAAVVAKNSSLKTAADVRRYLDFTVYPSEELMQSLIGQDLKLTPTELQVVVTLDRDPSAGNKALAKALDMRPYTVKEHLRHIYEKNDDVDNKAALISNIKHSMPRTRSF